MQKRETDCLSWMLLPLIIAVVLVLGLLGLVASLLRAAAYGLEWLGDAAEQVIADDCE
jgi:hypothetical protein